MSCEDSPSTIACPPDPARGTIVTFNAPKINCPQQRELVPISVEVTVDSAFWPPHWCWVGIFEDWGMAAGDEVACRSEQFSSSGTIVFNDIGLPEGYYIAMAGLSQSCWCRSWDSYDTTEWCRIIVGGDSCDVWRTFAFDYYRQGTLNAVPKGLSDVQEPYDPTGICLSMYAVADTLPLEWVIWDQTDPDFGTLIQYMADHVDVSTGCETHLFAVVGFKDPAGHVIVADGLSLRLDNAEWFSYVCVSRIVQYFRASDTAEAVSSTTEHELAHLVGNLSDACVRPDSHVVGQCVMSEIDYDFTTKELQLYCAPNQHWPYTDAFCDSCVSYLTNASWWRSEWREE